MKNVQKPALLLTIRNLFFTLLFLGVCLGSSAAQAQFTYITNNGAITIRRYTGLGGTLTIPKAIHAMPVTSIDAFAFYVFTPRYQHGSEQRDHS
jgi:hypothetical protein